MDPEQPLRFLTGYLAIAIVVFALQADAPRRLRVSVPIALGWLPILFVGGVTFLWCITAGQAFDALFRPRSPAPGNAEPTTPPPP